MLFKKLSLWLFIALSCLGSSVLSQLPRTSDTVIQTEHWQYIYCRDCGHTGAVLCSICKGEDHTTQTCVMCQGKDLSKEPCNNCAGTGVNVERGGKAAKCIVCDGSGHKSPCFFCDGTGHQPSCLNCRGTGVVTCLSCAGEGLVLAPVVENTQTKFSTPMVAENGSYYGQLNDNNVAKTVYVHGYYRKDGTYVQSHFRSPPSTNPSYQSTPSTPAKGPGVAENGSYYGEPSKITGKPKTTYVKGYYRKNGTYVKGHYRSKK